MVSGIRGSTVALGFVAVVAMATPGWARPSSVEGEWDAAGTHSAKGAYAGTVKITDAGNGDVRLSASYTVKSSGEKFKWVGTGRVTGNQVDFTMKLSGAGFIDRLLGGLARSESGKGSYQVSADRTRATGTWKSPRGTANETLAPHRASSTGGQLALSAGGKESKDEVVPLRTGVAGANELIDLKVKKVAGAPAGSTFELTLSSNGVALFSDAACTRAVDGKRLANEDATFKVKGVTASEPGDAVKVTLALKAPDGRVVAQDEARVTVSRSSFLLSGHGDFEMGSHLKSWIGSNGLAGRDNPRIAKGKDEKSGKSLFYAVYFLDSDEGSKIALSTPGSFVAYHGHSNFGLGYAFKTGFSKISQFFNIAEPQMPVNWQYLREHQEHPDLMFQDSEYADDAGTSEFSDPVQTGGTVLGKLKNYDTTHFPVRGGNGSRLHLTRDTKKKFLDHHYGSDDNWRIVVKAGAADMPAKRWSKLLLLSCYSGPYYYESFGGRGTLFYTWDEALCASEAASIFLEDMMSGKTNDATLKDLNRVENVHDYHEFGP